MDVVTPPPPASIEFLPESRAAALLRQEAE